MSRDDPVTVPPPAGEEDAYNATTKVGAMPAEVMARLRAEGLLPEADAPEPVPHSPRPAAPPRPVAVVEVPADASPPSSGSASKMDLPLLYSTAPPANVSAPDQQQQERRIPSPPPKLGGTLDDSYEFDDSNDEPFETTLALEPPPSKKPPPRIPRPEAPHFPDIQGALDRALDGSPDSKPPHAPPETVETPIAFTSSPQELVAVGLPQEQVEKNDERPHVAAADVPALPAPEDSALRRDVRAFGGIRRLTRQQVLALILAALVAVVALLFVMALLSQRR